MFVFEYAIRGILQFQSVFVIIQTLEGYVFTNAERNMYLVGVT